MRQSSAVVKKLAYPLSSDDSKIDAAYTYAEEISHGKDTLSGHWEITGVPVLFDWGYFPQQLKCFPKELVEKIIKQGNLPGVLGEKHASGTEIIKNWGRTSKDWQANYLHQRRQCFANCGA